MSDEEGSAGSEPSDEGTDAEDGPGPEATDAEDRDSPLSGLADRVRDRNRNRDRDADRDRAQDPFVDLGRDADRDRSSDPFDDLERGGAADSADSDDPDAAPGDLEGVIEGGDDADDDPFETMDVDTVDEEDVWESLEGDEEVAADQPEVGAGGDVERVDPEDPHVDAPEHVVEKTAYCQRCRFFTDPPDVRCTHEGTDIVEVVDSERFRVRACPMVERGGAGSHADRG